MKYCPFCGNCVKDTAKYCFKCGASLEKRKNVTGISDIRAAETVKQPAQEKKEYRAESRDGQGNPVCPSCGAALGDFSTVCPYCGRETGNTITTSACRELTQKLEEIEKSRPLPSKRSTMDVLIKTVDITGFIPDRHAEEEEKVDRDIAGKKMAVIADFPVPVNKADLIEFLLMSKSKVDYYNMHKFDRYSSDYLKIWQYKYNESCRTASALLDGDPDYLKVRSVIEKEEQEQNIPAELVNIKKKKFFSR